ncbi:GPI-anchored cell surface glycoprotein, putative [Talaromyces stipitatus ATCC 10500]|uniref:GPI-anchored cell surface glycoprotein, putative n=1 Tax=Talaromyces stipitatus (strain ATCC 10500 / CBS 375.48 / QM 6759 / NRRL 1006) TaxID=441959 RepID=B8M344_TALSN|nr:GPI-anchored cell surface glycoprotein, putative [Talaromyces stipitatus ATCC 10500]EED22020.1 GPI-anchored cell surface glycoprotein, putative [Talaromyces stipitatus ATCC 10500]
MSLNGLDGPAVIDAYQAALTEAGGWLLLKYASRDEVTLLGRGTGGVPDVRATVETYEEKSPLYGFLQYRRRKVVLKYVPEGMSRLVQARTTVQFQSILDRFSPQDTTFEFKAPGDLTESALSSACLLHAVSGSITSSSSSLRRRRLMEIAEDAEEGPPTTRAPPRVLQTPEETDDKRLSQASDATAVPPKEKGDDSPSIPPAPESEVDARSETASVRSVTRRRFLDQFQQDSFERRSSTQSMRPSLQELHYAAPYRQKVKMETRPSADINGRPRTAGSMTRGQEHRPTAALPAGVRSRRPSTNSNRPKSTPDVPPVPTLASLRNAPPVPLLIPPPTLSIAKPKLSPGAKSMNALPSSGMSPEKQRLMKALELRKKQMEKKTQDLQKKQAQITTTAIPSSESPRDKENTKHSPTKNDPTLPETGKTMADEPPAVSTNGIEDKKPLSADIAKADSAVEMVSLASKDTEPSISAAESEDTSSNAKNTTENQKDEQELRLELNDDPSQDDVKNGMPEITEIGEASASSEEETLTPRTTDSDNTIKVSGTTDIEETQEEKTEITDEAGNTTGEVVDTAAVDTEAGEQSETSQAADNNDDLSGLITIVASMDDLKGPETQEIASDAPIEGSKPIADANSWAEDIPLPLGSGDSLEEQGPAKSALETGSTGQEQPLPRPEGAEIEKSEKQRRLALLEPIRVSTPDFSDDENLLSDDSLMEELKSATVQEAQPVSVGKGPLSPNGEPRSPLEAWQTRAVSNPARRPSDFSSLPGESRSISATFVDNNNQAVRPVPVMVAKKVNVSSGISKRIKALEMFSNNHDSVATPAGNASATGNHLAAPGSSAFEKFRKRASVFSNGNLPLATAGTRSSFISTTESSPLNRSDSLPNANSVSVTARIVRDPSTPPTEMTADPLETNILNLQRSPLIVRHDSSETQSSNHVLSDSATDLRNNYFSPTGHSTNSSISRSESRASMRSQVEDWSSRNGSSGDIGANSDDKKDSRRSRFMRRMSALRSPSRKDLISPPPGIDKQRLQSPNAEGAAQSASAHAVDIGEVNVQFPDTLLWKRRFLRIDDQGYLVLTPGSTDTGARNIVKRYHLSEFKTPCLPDEERQELPNSILLDFRDGSTLQCACESRKGQAAALQTLVDAHTAYQH